MTTNRKDIYNIHKYFTKHEQNITMFNANGVNVS